MTADPAGQPPLWNTAVRVVANVRARTREEAAVLLGTALDRAGFDVIADDPAGPEGDYVSTGAVECEPGAAETPLPWSVPAGPAHGPARARGILPPAAGRAGGSGQRA